MFAIFLRYKESIDGQIYFLDLQEAIWGPAPAVNPTLKHQQQPRNDDDDASHKKKSKKKMQKVDNSFLGFTVLAAPDRINVGEIDSVDA